MSEKREIRLLDDLVINQIAAGEVVERPASVAKELMENSVDAGAQSIEVEVLKGGRDLVLVRDDGCGMDASSAMQAMDRHATSKLRTLSDLDRLETMGFRGEALPSIASASRFTMVTSEGGVEGTELAVFGGAVQYVRSTGAPKGTEIAVRNLFFNMPVRSRNLRGPSIEFQHVRRAFVLEALANLGISFTLKAEGEVVLRLPAAANLRERVQDIYGREVADHVREMDCGNGVVTVTGLAGIPPYSRPDSDWQIVMVNGRPATSGPVTYGIKTAYRDLLNAGRYAPLFLEIRLPPDQVDVNVHPAKKEVRFHHPIEVRDLVVEAIRDAVAGPRREVLPRREAVEFPPRRTGGDEFRLVNPVQGTLELPRAEAERRRAEERAANAGAGGEARSAAAAPVPQAPAPAPSAENAGAAGAGAETWKKSPWARYQILGRIGGEFVVLETEDGLVLMDPRSAHERVLYERLLQQMEKRKPESQGLLSPVVVEFSPAHHLAMMRHLKEFREMGFLLEPFGEFALKAEAVPAALAGEDVAAVLQDIADGVMTGGRAAAKDWLRPLVAERAGRRAVASKQALDGAALDRLVRELGETEMPYTSPRGKPTVILMSLSELRRKFGRA